MYLKLNQSGSLQTNTPDIGVIGGGAPASWVNDFKGFEFTEFLRNVL